MKRLVSKVVASEGVAIGRAYVVQRSNLPLKTIDAETSVDAAQQFKKALQQSTAELAALADGSEIFAAHYALIKDESLSESVMNYIANGSSALDACRAACNDYVAMFEAIDDEYLRERSADVRDIFRRIEENISGIHQNPFLDVKEGDILVADELFPSDMAMVDFSKIAGFITRRGSATSHICIVARNANVVAVVGVEGVDEVQTGDMLIVDGELSSVFLNPTQQQMAMYRAKMKTFHEMANNDNQTAHFAIVTPDGEKVSVYANAGSAADVELAIALGADGIGLLRSEFLFAGSDVQPTEEQQSEAYLAAAKACDGRPLTIRTLDVGGDKSLPYIDIPREDNPFLGYRAIRISLDEEQMFCRQMRAILRASTEGNIRIMFPMITTIEELRQAKMLLDRCRKELSDEGANFDKSLKVGVMIETPAAVMIARELAAECDFFSIGSNDLTQYVMAADRTNPKVASLYDSKNLAVMRAIEYVIRTARMCGIDCSICGELASDKSVTMELFGYGLRTFSVNLGAVGRIKSTLLKGLGR